MRQEKRINYISIHEASTLCDYSQDYLALRIRQGKIRGVKMGRNWVTTKEWVFEYIDRVNGKESKLKISVAPVKIEEDSFSSQFISLQDASRGCVYSQEYLSLRARQGKLRALKMGRNWVTKKEWLNEYLLSARREEKASEIAVAPVVKEKSQYPKRKQFFLPFDFGRVFNFQLDKGVLATACLALFCIVSDLAFVSDSRLKSLNNFENKISNNGKKIIYAEFFSAGNQYVKMFGLAKESLGLVDEKISSGISKAGINFVRTGNQARAGLEKLMAYSGYKLLSFKDSIQKKALQEAVNLTRVENLAFKIERLTAEFKFNSNFKNFVVNGRDSLENQFGIFISGVSSIPGNFYFYAKNDLGLLGGINGEITSEAKITASQAFSNIIGKVRVSLEKPSFELGIEYKESLSEYFEKKGDLTGGLAWQFNDLAENIDSKIGNLAKFLVSGARQSGEETGLALGGLSANYQLVIEKVKEKITKPFLALLGAFEKAKNYLAGIFKNPLPKNKLSLLPVVPKEQEVSIVSQNPESGLIVIPSTARDEEIKDEIRKSFSDEVKVVPKDADSGVIIPVFKEKVGEEYMYMMVPVKN